MTTAASGSDAASVFPATLPRWLASRSNAALVVCACIGLVIFTLLGSWAGVPAEPHHQISLLMQPSAALAILVTAIGLLATTLLLFVLQDSRDPLDPIFGAAVGLAAISWRGGTITDLLQTAPLSVFLLLIVEMVLLMGGLLGCYALVRRLRPVAVDPRLATTFDWNAGIMATAVAGIIMGLVVMVLAPTDAKKQVLAAVGIGGFAGASLAYLLLENECVLCYAAAPAAVAIVGYAWAYFFPGVYHIGRTSQPLAYPLPLDYASVGVGGALVGYWSAVRWRSES